MYVAICSPFYFFFTILSYFPTFQLYNHALFLYNFHFSIRCTSLHVKAFSLCCIDVLGERRLPRHSIDAGDLGKQRRSKMWDSDEEDDDYKYENDEHDDDDDDEREVLRSRRRASVAVTQTHAHSKRDGDKPPDEPLPVTDDTKWMYRDPQGDVQGPFTNAEMNEWYEAGYFGPDLMVKRVEDTTFVSLRVMTKKSGPTGPSTSPFTITPAPKPREVESDEESEEEPLRPKQASKQHQEKQVQQEPQQSPVKAERSLNKSTDVLSGIARE